MDAQYPNATEEDVGRMGDRVCIICREEMVVPGTQAHGEEAEAQAEPPTEPTLPEEGGPNETPKKLVCGHVFHFHCLRSWLERQQSCPTWCVTLP
jgi:E3 ubiquitin-protein ligase synoviolin